jgi:hypothetical protein
MLEKYDRLLQECTPYAVLNEQIKTFCNLQPLGLSLEKGQLISPHSRQSDSFLSAVQWLDKMTFGFAGMEMPRWVFYDCSEMPGGICGFCLPSERIPGSLFQQDSCAALEMELMPISMAIAIPMVQEGSWHKHTLCSINEMSSLVAPAGLRTITFAMALDLFQVKTLYSTTQWRSSELRIHTKFGELELLTAYTPAHSDPRTLTYRFQVNKKRVARALSGRDCYQKTPENAFFMDADNTGEMISVQKRLEAGEKISVCGRPIRDGSTTWIPLRTTG